MLQVALVLDRTAAKPVGHNPSRSRIAAAFRHQDQGRPADKWLADTVRWTWKIKVFMHLELELMNAPARARRRGSHPRLRRATCVTLLAAPARRGAGSTPASAPAARSPSSTATGKLLDTATIYPHEPAATGRHCRVWRHCAPETTVEADRIGNGTASRETDKLVADLMKRHPAMKLTKIVVSEAGASVVIRPRTRREGFPELDVSLRGAVSIARRLQDPLAELVKIEPKAIGVGQYQHDVSPDVPGKDPDAIVEDCVNAVGVDVNTASPSPCSRAFPASIPACRRTSSPTATSTAPSPTARPAGSAAPRRQDLRAGRRLPAHPRTATTRSMPRRCTRKLPGGRAHPGRHQEGHQGRHRRRTHREGRERRQIRRRQVRPADRAGHPRENWKSRAATRAWNSRPPRSAKASRSLDLEPGMMLEGVVTNVANFGAFVDIGVHQDGLGTPSALADRFVKDPHEVVRPATSSRSRCWKSTCNASAHCADHAHVGHADAEEGPAARQQRQSPGPALCARLAAA